MEDVLEITISSLIDTREPRRSERIVRAPDQFMFLGETVSDELDLDPSTTMRLFLTKIQKIGKVL